MDISLNENLKYEVFEKGDVVFQEGDKTNAFFIVIKGRIVCAKKNSDRMVVIFVAKEKDLVGEDSVLGNSGVHDYGAMALEKSELVRIEASDVACSIENQSEWIKNILENLSDKIKGATDLIAEHRIEDDRIVGVEPLSEELIAFIKTNLG